MVRNNATTGFDLNYDSRFYDQVGSVEPNRLTMKHNFKGDLPTDGKAGMFQQDCQRVRVDHLQETNSQFRVNRIKCSDDGVREITMEELGLSA